MQAESAPLTQATPRRRSPLNKGLIIQRFGKFDSYNCSKSCQEWSVCMMQNYFLNNFQFSSVTSLDECEKRPLNANVAPESSFRGLQIFN